MMRMTIVKLMLCLYVQGYGIASLSYKHHDDDDDDRGRGDNVKVNVICHVHKLIASPFPCNTSVIIKLMSTMRRLIQ